MAIDKSKYQSIEGILPAITLGPGDHIEEMLETNGWTQDDLAQIMGISPKHINQIITNKQSISFEIAIALSKIFKHSAQFWMNLDSEYRIRSYSNPIKSIEIEQKKEVYTYFPVKEMLKRAWISAGNCAADLVASIAKFQNSDEIDYQRQQFSLFRQSCAHQTPSDYAANAWLQRAKNISSKVLIPKFDRQALHDLAHDLSDFTHATNGLPVFLEKLADTGVVFFVLPHLQKTYLDGAAFWCGENPTIIYTGRLKRIDNFWFIIAHEIAHVLLHLDKETVILDDDKLVEKNEVIKKRETEANNMAALFLKHTRIAEAARGMRYVHDKHIQVIADTLLIHPAIVSGKLVHDKIINGNRLHAFNGDSLTLIPPKFIKD